MALPRKIKNFNAFVDGESYFGIATEAKLPQLKVMTEAHRGAGMDGPVGIDMGVEGMTAEITFGEWSPALLKKPGLQQRFVLRPAAAGEVGDGADTIIATIGGLITGTETGDLKPGTDTTLKLMMDVRYYRLEINGEQLVEIDLVNGKRVIGGVDQLADIRRAMGI
jgi:P2 family phage contractile tail tube protein